MLYKGEDINNKNRREVLKGLFNPYGYNLDSSIKYKKEETLQSKTGCNLEKDIKK